MVGTRTTGHAFGNLPLPCLVVLKPRPAQFQEQTAAASSSFAQEETAPFHRLALVLKADDTRVLLFDEQNRNPFDASLQEFGAQYTGQVVLFIASAQASAEVDPAV